MATPTAETTEQEALQLNDLEREVLAEEVASFATALRDPDSRARYEQLGAAVGQGAVPPELTGALETLLELLLPAQRLRLHHGHEADQALHQLWRRTPRGAALAQAAREVNEALGALRGQALESLSFTPTPRGHRLIVETERCRLTLAIDRGGVRVENVELGG